jgi:hypothetical protein
MSEESRKKAKADVVVDKLFSSKKVQELHELHDLAQITLQILTMEMEMDKDKSSSSLTTSQSRASPQA